MWLIVYLKYSPLTKSSYLKINKVNTEISYKREIFQRIKNSEKNVTSQIPIFQSDPSNLAQDAAHYVDRRKNSV